MSHDEAEQRLLMGASPWNDSEAEAARRTIVSAYSASREPSVH